MRRSPRLPLEQLEPYLLSTADPLTPLEGRAAFGNDRPIELEVGFGKGLFLLNAAQACPDVNFLGVEIERKYQLFTASRLAKRGLGNVRLVCADARLFLRDGIASASLQAVHVYFPDPWWKQRHRKRRVFTADFVAECERILKPEGKLHVATDVENYFRIISKLLSERPGLKPLPPPQEKGPEHDLDYLTNFERRFRKQGLPIYRGLYERQA